MHHILSPLCAPMPSKASSDSSFSGSDSSLSSQVEKKLWVSKFHQIEHNFLCGQQMLRVSFMLERSMTVNAQDAAQSCTALSLRCSALHCTTLHDTARRCTAMQDTARNCAALHLGCSARHCTTLLGTTLETSVGARLHLRKEPTGGIVKNENEKHISDWSFLLVSGSFCLFLLFLLFLSLS